MANATQTPQRPVPGAFTNTPGPRQPNPPEPTPRPPPITPELNAVERAAKTINDTLEFQRIRYPELEHYVNQGISSDYNVATEAVPGPFQKVKSFPIPDRIFEQYNQSQMRTTMGLFADLGHAWVAIDNALYMWDYAQQNPDLIGFEEQPNAISAVSMVKPREGVFIPAITRLIVIATSMEVLLVGVSVEDLPAGGRRVTLYQTRMAAPVRGLDIQAIEGDPTTGRIFFATADNDVYELYYQQEERWFFNRCWKINHTTSRVSAFKPSLSAFGFGKGDPVEGTTKLALDGSRQLLYTLSTKSTIRVFHLKPGNAMDLVITKTLRDTLGNIAHMIQQTELLSTNTTIVDIHPISSKESSKLHLVATTATGCRIFMSATSSFAYLSSGQSSIPTSMQVHHVRFPPADTNLNATLLAPTPPSSQTVNTTSKALIPTNKSARYAPGYFFDFVAAPRDSRDRVFLAAPDSGRLAYMGEQAQGFRFLENGMWISLEGRAAAVGLATEPFAAAESPVGFGNELVVQHDRSTTEIAILTNTGVFTYRRLRLVDEFASAVRLGRAEDGLEGSVRAFVRIYGRGETAACALAVVCGQGMDVTNDFRVASITDPDVLEGARTAFIEYGGRPQLNENSLLDQTAAAIDLVKPSPRHDGVALYISRVVRSLWNTTIADQKTEPARGLIITSTVATEKLQDVQQKLTRLQEFVNANRTFIEGLSGPEAMGRAATRQEEVALQAENRALHALVTLVSNMIEGISFVQMLFGERIEEIVLSLSQEAREQFKSLTYESLFCTPDGRSLAKDLVKAIVNRNIQNGYNVDTVADSLRRRCGSFCSASDVVIFKAQENLKRSAEKGKLTEFGRSLLNESLRLFNTVVDSLSLPQLQDAVSQYIQMEFWAGAIELCLELAREKDRGNRALAWIEAGRPENDTAAAIFAERKRCYALIHQIIHAVDHIQIAAADSEFSTEQDMNTRRKAVAEARSAIDDSDDEVFQNDLYDWYISNDQAEKLLQVQSPYLVRYLQRKAQDDISIADLLWKYHTQSGRLFEAAQVQFDLANSEFHLSLDQRIRYLSRARANASSFVAGPGRANRQQLLRNISDALEIANIQSDILQNIRDDDRFQGDRREQVVTIVNGRLLPLSEVSI